MKRPVAPDKPYPPYKPSPPEKQITERTTIHTVEIDEYSSYNLAEILDSVKQNIGSFDPKEINLQLEVEKTDTYYDEVIINYRLIVSVNHLINNPNYDEKHKKYLIALEKYNKAMAAHKEKLKKYKTDLATYEVANDKYMLDLNKQQVKRLQKKLNKLKGNKK